MTLPLGIPGLTFDEGALVDELWTLRENKLRRNALRAAYYDGRNAVADLGISIPPQLRNLAVVLGWPAKAVDVLNRRCRLDGFAAPGSVVDDLGIEQIWADNRLDAEAPQVGTSSLVHSVAFLITTRGDVAAGEPEALIIAKDALSGAALWDARRRRISAFLSVVETDGAQPLVLILYLPGVTITMSKQQNGNWAIDRRGTGLDRVLVEPVTYRPRIGRPFGSSRISRAVMSLTDSAMRTVMRSEVSAEFYSSPQRYLLGADESAFQDAQGNVKSQWQVVLGRMLAMDRDEDGELPVVGQFPQMSQQPHIDQLRAWAQLFAGETNIPVTSLGISTDANPASAEAYKASREDLIMEALGTTRGWGHAWAQTMRNAVLVRDGSVPTELDRLRPVWADVETTTRAAAADATVKLIGAFPWMANSPAALDMLGLGRDTTERLLSDQQGTPVVMGVEPAPETT